MVLILLLAFLAFVATSSVYAARGCPSLTPTFLTLQTDSPVVNRISATPSPVTRASYAGAKRGLAYNQVSLCKLFDDRYGFRYNWGQVEDEEKTANFIPMIHSPMKSSVDDWLTNVEKAVTNGAQAVMGFNECDHAEQCNLTPEAACSAWRQYMGPIKTKYPNITIIGPSVTNGPAPMGLHWLSRFFTVCPDAIVDATNIHFYDIYEPTTIDRFKAQVELAATTYGRKVWITEFGLNPGTATPDQAGKFLRDCIVYLEGSDDVQGYSWFMVGTGENQLVAGSELSSLGAIYASLERFAG